MLQSLTIHDKGPIGRPLEDSVDKGLVVEYQSTSGKGELVDFGKDETVVMPRAEIPRIT